MYLTRSSKPLPTLLLYGGRPHMNQVFAALWLSNSDEKTREQQYDAALAAMLGIKPADELEGMLAAQLLATHFAAMECHRRAMLDGQTFEGRRENLNQA